jgi:hypothetical protein
MLKVLGVFASFNRKQLLRFRLNPIGLPSFKNYGSSTSFLDIIYDELRKDKYEFIAPRSEADCSAQYVERILNESSYVDNKAVLINLLEAIRNSESYQGTRILSVEAKVMNSFFSQNQPRPRP